MNASADAGEAVAVTLPTPPFSSIDAGVSTSVTDGGVAPSSSRILRVASAGARTPSRDTEPETVTVLSGASSSLSTAVIVTSPLLCVASASNLSVVPESVKSPATAGATAAAETVTVNASGDAGDTVAVRVLAPPSSATEPGLSTSVTDGGVAPSSSRILRVASAGARTSSRDTEPETVTILSGASSSLSTAVIVTSPLLCRRIGGKAQASCRPA